MNVRDFSAHKKAVWIVVAILLTTSVSGFFMGLRQTNTAARAAADEAEINSALPTGSATGVPTVVDYSRLGATNYKANANWENKLENLKQSSADLFAEI
ncbi:MAG: hypothetical protein ACK4UN_22515, partial [Limisphaerales bacterium]